jgi:large subunit ribosomal protein L33
MSQETLIKLECGECKSAIRYSRKNKKILKERLELSKYCKKCKKNTPHKETK